MTKNRRSITLNKEQLSDVLNLTTGAYLPLTGFLGPDDFESVVVKMRLSDESIWPIPIVLDINDTEREGIEGENSIELKNTEGVPVAILKNPIVYKYDPEFFAKNVFGTLDKNHPGVANVFRMGKYLVGGEVESINLNKNWLPRHYLTPEETKEIFKKRNWKTIAAFQTRNVPHVGHEFLQKHALKTVDGLLIQPVIGEKKDGDFRDEHILATYEALIEHYHDSKRVLLSVLPLKMRYAGPREAVFHALIRRNFGCTHFIVGRDHAGVGDHYHPFAAQNIFNDFDKRELGVEIIKAPEVVYDKNRKGHFFVDEVPEENRASFSGTQLREHIQNKEQPPEYVIRPEVYNILSVVDNPFVDETYRKSHVTGHTLLRKGMVLWFTGLPQAGKSTIADKVAETLREKGWRVERLDGDVVRRHLTKDLGFSREDRNENIKRVGVVANHLSQGGICVLAAFVSPFREQREKLRKNISNFIEIFCDAPLNICEARDTRGMYAKARRGEIENFTGVSDPYESPVNSDIHLKTGENNADNCAAIVVKYLFNKERLSNT